VAIDLCPCLEAGARFDQFKPAPLGDDDRYGEASLWTCRSCGRVWLHYLLEYEATPRSGRWYRGQIPPGTRVAPREAAAVFAGIPGYLAGGSYFEGQPHRRSGPPDRDTYLPGSPVRRTDFRPAGAREVALSPDLSEIAILRDAESPPTLSVEPVSPGRKQPRTSQPGFQGIHDLAWSAPGDVLTFLAQDGPPGSISGLRWCDRELDTYWGLVGVLSYAGEANGGVIIASHTTRSMARVPKSEPLEQKLFPLSDDGDPLLAPWIAPSPDGTRVAYTCRRVADEVTELWVDGRLLTQIPGASVQASPFWSPDGKSLGIHLVHLEQEKSSILVVPNLEGEGEILYARDLLDLPGPGAWSPSGRSIAFFRTQTPKHEFTKSGEPQLVLLDVQTGELWPLTEPGQATGRPRFVDGRRLVVDGGPAAHLFEFSIPV
jgi:WD40 repeat protein